jgi:hypothetical protein
MAWASGSAERVTGLGSVALAAGWGLWWRPEGVGFGQRGGLGRPVVLGLGCVAAAATVWQCMGSLGSRHALEKARSSTIARLCLWLGQVQCFGLFRCWLAVSCSVLVLGAGAGGYDWPCCGLCFLCGFYPCVPSMAWTMMLPWFLLWPLFCGASKVWSSCLSVLASATHLWATVRVISFRK